MAKTPMIAGIVSGSCVGLAWFIGFIIYFYKRHRREKRARALGFRNHREMLDPPKKQEAFIIPPRPSHHRGGPQARREHLRRPESAGLGHAETCSHAPHRAGRALRAPRGRGEDFGCAPNTTHVVCAFSRPSILQSAPLIVVTDVAQLIFPVSLQRLPSAVYILDDTH